MAEATTANRLGSFDYVKDEIDSTIQQAEQSLHTFQQNRESGEDLQNCIDFVNQLRGIFVLVELQGGVMLCQETVSVANELPVGATDSKNNLLTAVNNALFILKRYVEYFEQRREDHPELLLPLINDLRVARNVKPFPDSHFFDVDSSATVNICALSNLKPEEGNPQNYEQRARKLRHMYQVALLGLIRDENLFVCQKLMARTCQGLIRLCGKGDLSQLWCLMTVVMQCMMDRQLEVTKSRKRLLMRVEKYAREMVYVGPVVSAKSAPDSIIKELLYILAMSGSHNQEVMAILEGFGTYPLEVNEQILIDHRRQLFGPGQDVLKSLATAMQEEVSQLKDKLDILERGIDPDMNDLDSLKGNLERLAGTLKMLDLNKLGALVTAQKALLDDCTSNQRTPSEEEMLGIADAVLGVEQAANKLITTGITSEADAPLQKDEEGTSPYLTEAMIVVVDEAQAGLALTKRGVTAYVESDFDRLHLANVNTTLNSVRGSMALIGEERFAQCTGGILACIEERLLNADKAPDEHTLETIADVLTSLEYYIETLSGRDKANPELLTLAEDSLKSAGYLSAG